MRPRLALPSLAALATALPGAALAHHPMGGQAPSTWMEGLLSGVGHPVLGLDHLAFVVGLGCLAAVDARWRRLTFAFAAPVAPGVLAHVAGVGLGPQELYVALSLVMLGAALALERRLVGWGLVAFAAAAGFFHGYAFGEAVGGSGPATVAAYALGLTGTVLGLALAVSETLRRGLDRARMVRLQPLAGLSLSLAGLAFAGAAATL